MARVKHPPGTIGLSLGEIVRYASFLMSLSAVWRPPGSVVASGQSVAIAENLNAITRMMLATPSHQWLWVQADDHVWRKDALRKLLDCQVDVVVPLIIRRGPPFLPVINKRRTRAGFLSYGYDEIPTSGTWEIGSVAGSGGMLIRRHVIEAVVEWQGHERLWEYSKGDNTNEDYLLSQKIRRAGFTIHCCSDVVMGHSALFTVWPEVVSRDDGEHWRLRFDMGTNREGQMSSFYLDTDNQPRKE